MPSRIVVDENGFVISVEQVPEREPPKPSVRRKGPKVKKSRARSQRPATSKSKSMASVAPGPRKLPPRGLSAQQRLSGRRYVQCSVCGVNLRDSNWEKHLKKVHSSKAGRSGGKVRPSVPTAKKGKRGTGASPQQRERVIRSLFEETNFGDKYLGQMRREPEGRFGSLPLYDDYGEESGPD